MSQLILNYLRLICCEGNKLTFRTEILFLFRDKGSNPGCGISPNTLMRIDQLNWLYADSSLPLLWPRFVRGSSRILPAVSLNLFIKSQVIPPSLQTAIFTYKNTHIFATTPLLIFYTGNNYLHFCGIYYDFCGLSKVDQVCMSLTEISLGFTLSGLLMK